MFTVAGNWQQVNQSNVQCSINAILLQPYLQGFPHPWVPRGSHLMSPVTHQPCLPAYANGPQRHILISLGSVLTKVGSHELRSRGQVGAHLEAPERPPLNAKPAARLFKCGLQQQD